MHLKLEWTKLLFFLNLITLFTLPQLNNVHYDPSASFYGQATFACASITIFIIIITTQKKLTIPFVVIPLVIFALYILVQPYFISIPFIGLNYSTAIEMLICVLLAIAINTFVNRYGLENFVLYLSIALVIGAILQSLIGFIQYANLFKYFGGLIFYDSSHPTTNIFGHFGQRNHYCHFLTWATFALIYLYIKKILNGYLFLIIMLWLIFSITIAASRSVFIYFALASLITLLHFMIKRDNISKKFFIITLLTFLSLVAFEYLYPLLHYTFSTLKIDSGLTRMVENNPTEAGRRIFEWKKAWIVFKTHPLFGSGLFGYARNSVFLFQLFPNTPLNNGLFTNCHNLILQLLAETGVIGSLIVILGVIYLCIKIANQQSTIIPIFCMIATVLAHSMLEYPLWYFYFLGPFIMFLSIDKPIVSLSSKILLLPAFGIIGWLTFIVVTSSITYDQLTNYMSTPNNILAFKKQANELKQIANNNVLASYLAIFTLDNYIEPDNEFTNQTFSINEQLYYESLFSNFQPYPNNLIKLAKLEWNYGNKYTAKQLIITATNAFPIYKDSLTSSLHRKKYKTLYNLANKGQFQLNR